MAAFLYRIPAGIPGSYNRTEHLTVEAGLLLVGSAPTAYGLPLALDPVSGRYRAITTGDTAEDVRGLLVRPYPSGSLGSDGLGPVTPSVAQIANIMKRGYMHALVGGAAAASKGGTVYIRVATPAAGRPIGGFEAAADGANTIALPPTSYWMGPADAQGNGEIAYNI